ncbi:hypothetical protein [Ewingella americana]|uniref:Uncharacterized protein n=1 Tax=Ewingella americana TaxID=41202 RepID=A0A502GMW8_9GAMM|nr:hypothetical protein [Ewingella americana]TPG63135.1 hypothetical protein EAH77_06005 [Ewingella americana]
MHIDLLITRLKAALPSITNEAMAQEFLNSLSEFDQLAIFSAYKIGNAHISYHRLMPEYENVTRSLEGYIPVANFAKMLYEKRLVMKNSMETFIRCTDGSGFNRDNF